MAGRDKPKPRPPFDAETRIEESGKERPTEIRFTFEKSKFFRVIHVDGAHGGLSPNGHGIAMSLFSERRTIPREHVFGIKGNELEAEPKKVDDRGGIFREVEVCAIMDIGVARALHKFLAKQIETYDEVRKVIEKHSKERS